MEEEEIVEQWVGDLANIWVSILTNEFASHPMIKVRDDDDDQGHLPYFVYTPNDARKLRDALTKSLELIGADK